MGRVSGPIRGYPELEGPCKQLKAGTTTLQHLSAKSFGPCVPGANLKTSTLLDDFKAKDLVANFQTKQS